MDLSQIWEVLWKSEKMKIWSLPIKSQFQIFQLCHFFKGSLKNRGVYFYAKTKISFLMSSFFYSAKSILKVFKDPKFLNISVNPSSSIPELGVNFYYLWIKEFTIRNLSKINWGFPNFATVLELYWRLWPLYLKFSRNLIKLKLEDYDFLLQKL